LIFASGLGALPPVWRCSQESAEKTHRGKMTYPETRKDSTAGQTLHGTFVADPYRWLENDTSAETAEWVKRQNAVTNAYLAKIPFRKAIAKRYEELFNFPKLGGAHARG
jgi:prolyl oligopeptidase